MSQNKCRLYLQLYQICSMELLSYMNQLILLEHIECHFHKV